MCEQTREMKQVC